MDSILGWDSFKSAIHDNPSLATIDKFSYFQSLLEGKAKQTIAGLALTDANYSTAVDLLEKRFGNKERITAAHMGVLIRLDAVCSDHNFELRCLHNETESTIRSLSALGGPVDFYGALLAPMFTKKVPIELRLAIARKVPADYWNMTRILEVLLAEVEARERASLPKTKQSSSTTKHGRDFATAATFTGGSQSDCCFCQQKDHTPAQCTKVTGVDERKRMIREQCRCFVCFRPGHISKHCHISMSCATCKGRHYSSVCMKNSKP
uniref:CCHC-type domain-containing protein n=1 Tax=Amphimedon queenslandica TaxID=400682 RepID=A0A1X7UJA6_AMPQE